MALGVPGWADIGLGMQRWFCLDRRLVEVGGAPLQELEWSAHFLVGARRQNEQDNDPNSPHGWTRNYPYNEARPAQCRTQIIAPGIYRGTGSSAKVL